MDADAVPFIRSAALQDSDVRQQTVEETLWNQMLQIWDEVGESDGKPYEMLRQINQECSDIYKRKVDEAAAKSRALLPQNAFWEDTTCETLMKRLEEIWHEDDVGEDERNEMLQQLDQECLEVYKRKAGEAANVRELLHLTLGLENIPFKLTGNINKQLEAVRLNQEHLLLLKDKRKVVFADARSQILKLREEIAGNSKLTEQAEAPVVSEDDLSLKKLAELRCELLGLQEKAALQDSKEVAEGRQKLSDAQHTELAAVAFRADTTCATLLKQLHQIWDEECLDIYKKNVDQAGKSSAHLSQQMQHEVGEEDDKHNDMLHQIDQELFGVYEIKVDEAANLTKSINNGTFSELEKTVELLKREELQKTSSKLAQTVEFLTKEKMERLRMVQHLAAQLFELWSLMDTSPEERSMFDHVACYISATVDEVTLPGALDLAWIEDAKWEVRRLEVKVSTKEDPNKEHIESARLKFLKAHDSVRAVYDLCSVLGMDFLNITDEVHPGLVMGLRPDIIDDELLSKLARTVENLKQEKMQRLEKLQELAGQLYDLWNFMDTSPEERSSFQHSQPEALALSCINHAKVEVERLEMMKACKVTEIPFNTISLAR
ncbi:hypothetical protein MKW92_001495 [Papaver armeniacum]|nr:hypothetical protein MKW92_001495 [Papaver armeniacum]